jgi:hypothetical protein
MTGTDQQPRLNWATLVFLAAPTAYFLAFVHEFAYASVFAYPSSFITIQIAAIVQAIVGLLGAAASLYIYFALFYFGIKRGGLRGVLGFRLAFLWGSLIVTFGIVRIYAKHPGEWILYAVLFLLYPVLNLILPLLIHRKVNGLEAKFQVDEANEDATPSLVTRAVALAGRQLSFLIALLALLTLFSYSLGRADAMDSTSYLVTTFEGQQMIVLRTYGNEVIMMPKSHPEDRLSGKYVVTFISDAHPLVAEAQDVGPLVRDCQILIGCH